MFTEEEIQYLSTQQVARLGTVGTDGQVDTSPVGFEFDGEAFYIGSSMMDRTFKGKNIDAGNVQVSLVIDDLPSTNPYQPRGIKVHGLADFVERPAPRHMGGGVARYIRVRPVTSWSFGILAPGFADGKWTTNKMAWPPLK